MREVGIVFEEKIENVENNLREHFEKNSFYFKSVHFNETEEGIKIELFLGDDHFRIFNEKDSLALISDVYGIQAYKMSIERTFGLLNVISLRESNISYVQ